MSLSQAQQIARAVLYEGHIRYPYRAPTLKHRQRRAFCTLFPEQYVATGHVDPSVLQTQCLLRGADHAALEVELHFLQMRERQVGKLPRPVRGLPTDAAVIFKPVDNLTVDGQHYRSWQEGVEREVRQQVPRVADLAEVGLRNSFRISAHRSIEPVTARDGSIPAVLARNGRSLAGKLELSAELLGDGLYRLTARVINCSELPEGEPLDRLRAQCFALTSTHIIVNAYDAEFISLLDPPAECADHAANSINRGAWPVLTGGERNPPLASPIILFDYPVVAPKSPGELFDSTEFDEPLSLHIVPLSEQEKSQMAGLAPRTRAMPGRSEQLNPERRDVLDGTLGNGQEGSNLEPKPAENRTAEQTQPALVPGQRVRLIPKKGRSDIRELALAGKRATIETVEEDFEGRRYVAVVMDDAPGRESGLDLSGHRFIFAPDELEPLDSAEKTR